MMNGKSFEFLVLHLRKSDAALALILSAAVFVGRFADLIRFEEYDLRNSLIRINLGGQRRGVGKLERHIAFPFRFKRRDVYQDPTPCIRTLAEANSQNVPGDAKVFDRARERKTVWRNQYRFGFNIHEILLIEFLRIDYRAVDVGEEFEFIGAANVVTIARRAVRNDLSAIYFLHLARFKRIDHSELARHFPDPFI